MITALCVFDAPNGLRKGWRRRRYSKMSFDRQCIAENLKNVITGKSLALVYDFFFFYFRSVANSFLTGRFFLIILKKKRKKEKRMIASRCMTFVTRVHTGIRTHIQAARHRYFVDFCDFIADYKIELSNAIHIIC